MSRYSNRRRRIAKNKVKEHNNLAFLNSRMHVDQRVFNQLARVNRYITPSYIFNQRKFNSAPGSIRDNLKPEYKDLYDRGLLKI